MEVPLFSLFALICLVFLFGTYILGGRMEDKVADDAMKSIAFGVGIFVILFWIAFMYSMTLIS